VPDCNQFFAKIAFQNIFFDSVRKERRWGRERLVRRPTAGIGKIRQVRFVKFLLGSIEQVNIFKWANFEKKFDQHQQE